LKKYRIYLGKKNTSTVKAPAVKDLKPYIAKIDLVKSSRNNRNSSFKGNAKIEIDNSLITNLRSNCK
jgi:hypothetical protein